MTEPSACWEISQQPELSALSGRLQVVFKLVPLFSAASRTFCWAVSPSELAADILSVMAFFIINLKSCDFTDKLACFVQKSQFYKKNFDFYDTKFWFDVKDFVKFNENICVLQLKIVIFQSLWVNKKREKYYFEKLQ